MALSRLMRSMGAAGTELHCLSRTSGAVRPAAAPAGHSTAIDEVADDAIQTWALRLNEYGVVISLFPAADAA